MSSTTAVRSTFPPPSFSDSDSDYDSPTTFSANTHRQPDLSSTVFKSYIDINGKFSPNLTKIKSFLNSSSAGALSCLICLERIKPSDPTWSCTSRCFDVFHLVCIQSWARQSSDLASLRASTRLPISDSAAASDIHSIWNCPKCRSEYPKTLIPKTYYCFCGKVENPPCDPWVLPHSCGEICNRDLQGKCGHYCLLLCHPGPCPSCPQQVRSWCFCGAVQDVRRCGTKSFSCDGICSKELDCGRHRCGEICHEGECPPCRERGVYMCQCGKVEEERECCERSFRCEFPCEKLLGCGKHFCEKGCHKEECGECPFQGQRTCPCGRRVYSGMACDSAVQLCGATCDKMLNCGLHRCPERCHRGPCVETCRTVVTKSCRCGSLKKQVPCYQDLACERKCQRLRDCGRHACKRRCCDGECPPCSEICDRKLRCRNHKCPSPCHRGSCAPCPVMVRISCFCGETYFEVPCGTEREQQPPRCHKPCGIAPLCRHGSDCKPHKCHYGACPPCRLICDEEYPCGHKCNLRCHGPKPPPNPEFTLKPKKKRSHCPSECTPGSPCPPCPEHVWQSCRGHHAGKMMICSDRKEFCCDNFCGNLLPCGNHYCTKTCHALKGQSSVPETGESCEACYLPCQKIMMERDTGVPRGFGSQTFVDCRGMEDSIREMHGREFGDKTISVNKAQPRMNGEDAGRDYSGGYLSGGRGSYGEDRSLGKDECFKCGRHGHCALECPSDGGGREDRYGDRYGNYLLNYRYDGGRYFGDRYEIRETRYGDYVGDPYKIRETRFDDYLGYYCDIDSRYGDYRGHPYAIRDTRYDDCGADRCKTRETLYGDCYVNNQYDGGRYGYGPYGGDNYKIRETKYGSRDYVGERYQPHSYGFEGDRYGASDRYITSGNGNERLYERDAALRRRSERYGGLGPASYECKGFRERVGPYDRPNTGQERPSSFRRY